MLVSPSLDPNPGRQNESPDSVPTVPVPTTYTCSVVSGHNWVGANGQESSHAEKEVGGAGGGAGGGGVASPCGFNSLHESKAAKVATLSQALGYVDQYR